ncbi:MAG: tape measure protein [Clostridia bacterium]|nr:tape measure protein [Clostridia bacterium]
MATISSTIELYDRISAPVNRIIGVLNNMVGIFESVETAMDSGFDPSAIDETRRAIDLASAEMNQLGEEILKSKQKQEKFNDKIDDATSKLMSFVGAYASMQGLSKLVDLSDTYVQTTARLNMINDGLQTTDELQDKIFASAQRARASYTVTADTVAKLSLNAGDAFGSNDETILFAENLNKLFAVAGTEQASIASASLQLTQALGSGVLRGEEFNAVFEAAPNIMQTVADYMNVPIGKLRGMAAEGQITADIVKNALLGATDDINAQFESMPMTWAQVWTGVMNKLYQVSQPILEAISWLAQNWSILEPIVIGLVTAVGLYTAALLINKGVQVASTIAKTIDTIKSIAHGAAITAEMTATTGMTSAQLAFNAALYACPLTWILLIIIAVIAAIYAVIAVINKVTGKSISATGVIVGAVMTAVAFIWNLFLGLVDLVLGIINIFWNRFAMFANFFGNVFNDPIGSIIHLFGDMADSVLGILETIASAIDKIFGFNLVGAVAGWRSGLDGMVNEFALKYGNGTYEEKVSKANLTAESLGLSRWGYGDAYQTGYDWGANLGESTADAFNVDKILSDLGTTAEATEETANALAITNEDLKYLKDLAEQDVINRFTTAEIKVDMTNNNSINGDMDLDGVVEYLVIGVNEAMEKVAEGVHV